MLVTLLSAPAVARAQTEGTLSLGANFTTWLPRDPAAHVDRSIGLLWRFGHPETGWGWHWGLNWFETSVDRTVGGRNVTLGELHVRPFMAGYGYTRVLGRTAITGEVIGGFALNSFTITPDATDAYHDRLGARSVRADAANALVLRPGVSMWYDVNKKIGINVNAGYIIARPRVTVTTSLGEDARRIRADVFGVKVGVAYSIF
jgi:hypothetical protein